MPRYCAFRPASRAVVTGGGVCVCCGIGKRPAAPAQSEARRRTDGIQSASCARRPYARCCRRPRPPWSAATHIPCRTPWRRIEPRLRPATVGTDDPNRCHRAGHRPGLCARVEVLLHLVIGPQRHLADREFAAEIPAGPDQFDQGFGIGDIAGIEHRAGRDLARLARPQQAPYPAWHRFDLGLQHVGDFGPDGHELPAPGRIGGEIQFRSQPARHLVNAVEQ